MINYRYIADSCAFYSRIGYKRLEVDWWAPKDIVHITKPADIKDREDFYLPVNDQVLVASAEQSFLALAAKNQMPIGKFFAVTPCFRNEPITKLSGKYFIKTELIDTIDISDDSLSEMIDDAYGFLGGLVPEVGKLDIVKTPEGFDIEYDGVELGSYGIRSCEYLDWVYGTGVAEPRLSKAIEASQSKRFDWPLL